MVATDILIIFEHSQSTCPQALHNNNRTIHSLLRKNLKFPQGCQVNNTEETKSSARISLIHFTNPFRFTACGSVFLIRAMQTPCLNEHILLGIRICIRINNSMVTLLILQHALTQINCKRTTRVFR